MIIFDKRFKGYVLDNNVVMAKFELDVGLPTSIGIVLISGRVFLASYQEVHDHVASCSRDCGWRNILGEWPREEALVPVNIANLPY